MVPLSPTPTAKTSLVFAAATNRPACLALVIRCADERNGTLGTRDNAPPRTASGQINKTRDLELAGSTECYSPGCRHSEPAGLCRPRNLRPVTMGIQLVRQRCNKGYARLGREEPQSARPQPLPYERMGAACLPRRTPIGTARDLTCVELYMFCQEGSFIHYHAKPHLTPPRDKKYA